MRTKLALSLMLLILPALVLAQNSVPLEPKTNIIDTRAAWEHVSRARDHAAADRHHDAVAEYLEALADDASLMPQVVREIAYQKLWHEDADKAIFYFKRYLASHPGEDTPSVQRGLALAYSWSGRQPEAIDLYRRLVQNDGSAGEARQGLGRSLIWNNNLREGFRVVRAVEDEFPADFGPGRHASNFLLTVLDGYTPHLQMSVRSTWDSDDLDSYRPGAEIHFEVLGNMLWQVAPSVALFRMPDRPDVTAPRFQMGLIGPLAHNWALHAYGWVDQFISDAPISAATSEDLEWTRPGGDLWLTWMAHPKLRVDFGGSSQPVLTYEALAKELGFEQAGGSFDWRFARHFSFGLGGIYGHYSDENVKKQGKANLYWRRDGKVQIVTGPVLTYMDFKQPYPGGYWAPDWVRNAGWRIMLETRAGRSVFKIDGGLGLEKENGSDALTVGSLSGHWGWRFDDNWLGAVEVGHSRSRFDSDTGYKRVFLNVMLRAMF